MEYLRNDELLSAYLDRELSPDERAAMDRLLERSPEARERLRELEVTSRFVRRLPQHTVDTDLAECVIERLRNDSLLRPPPIEPVRKSHRLSWRISAPLAAAATVLIAVWLMHRPDRPITSPLAKNLSTPDRWEDLKAGDFFDLVGPEGESPFRLIVVEKQPDTDQVRCFLVDKSERAEDLEADEQRDRTALGGTENVSILALQANRDQLDALEKAYVLASSSAAVEPFPVVDIYARPDELAVGDVKAHAHFRGGNTEHGLAQQAPIGGQEPKTIPAGAARSGVAGTDVPPPPEVAQSLPGTQVMPPSDVPDGDKDVAKGESSGAVANNSASQAERNQKRFVAVIEWLLVQDHVNVKSDSKDESPRKTSVGVGGLAGADDPRIAQVRGKADKQSAGRVQVLLRFKDNLESEQSHP
jgi:hypothetical protein